MGVPHGGLSRWIPTLMMGSVTSAVETEVQHGITVLASIREEAVMEDTVDLGDAAGNEEPGNWTPLLSSGLVIVGFSLLVADDNGGSGEVGLFL